MFHVISDILGFGGGEGSPSYLNQTQPCKYYIKALCDISSYVSDQKLK